ncbi:MAG TPA: DUF2384 domain-containing protein [Niabella sp.]|nr:DUF2384 domain-containing protein [Niabella sp.]
MKSRKSIYDHFAEEDLSIVEEAAVAYNVSNKNITEPLALMGIQDYGNFNTIDNTTGFISYIREGIPKKALDHLAEIMALSDAELSAVLHISDRTLRRYTSSQKLNAEQSERVLELARLYARGADVFEDMESFKLWMESPVGALGNKKPKSFLDTSMGIALLIEELGRIEQGIFA